MESVNYQNQEIKRWDVGPSTFLALPEKGARLLNWHINMSDGSVRDIIHWPKNIIKIISPIPMAVFLFFSFCREVL